MSRILVLDDLPDAVLLLQGVLGPHGHEVIGFTDEEQAIAYARSNRLDLLILEVKLRRMNGIEVLEEIRKVNSSAKAMILTGYPTLETARRAKELGVQEYCIKPIDNEELVKTVASVVGRQT